MAFDFLAVVGLTVNLMCVIHMGLATMRETAFVFQDVSRRSSGGEGLGHGRVGAVERA